MKLHKVSALAAVSVLAFAACSSSGSSAAPSTRAPAPRRRAPRPASPRRASSSSASRCPFRAARRPTASRPSRARSSPSTRPTRPAAIGGYTIKLVAARSCRQRQVQRAAGRGGHDRRSSPNPKVIGVVGPYNSAVAKVQIPISNSAGLLQCSPANTNETLTKPPDALDFRKTNPDQDQLHPGRRHGRHPGPGHGGLRLQHARPQEAPDRR